ncbi:MAG: response regulator transcription factor [Synechococcales bacterium]|nr:response regulator transcription factor [Synechococcales bacterium]
MPLTILVAEDDLGTRVAVSDYLESLGFWVVPAENGKKALALIEQERPHLIVTDIAMPELDGYSLIRQVRRHPNLRLIPVIFLTGRTELNSRIQGYQLGCDVYLEKPFELVELGAIVRNLLDRTQMMLEWRVSSDLPPQSDLSEIPTPDSIYRRTPHLQAIEMSSREQEVLHWLSEGYSNGQIGEKLHLSSRTIEKHVSNLLRKTETNNRAELVRFAMSHHLVT